MPSCTLLGTLYILLRVSNLFVLTRRLPTAEVVERAAGDTLVFRMWFIKVTNHSGIWVSVRATIYFVVSILEAMNCHKDDAEIAGQVKQRYQEILNSSDYKSELSKMAIRIITKSRNAPNEATIEGYFDSELFAFFREKFSLLGFEYSPVKEKSVATRHTLRGRADSALTSLIIEFKQPATLRNKTLKDAAVTQIEDYIESLTAETNDVYQGFVTDGVHCCFVKYSNGEFVPEPFYMIDGVALDKLIRYILQVELIALNAKNLVAAICNPPENNGLAFTIAKSLFTILETNIHPKTQMLYDEWRQLFNLAHDDISKQQAIIDRKKSLELLFNKSFKHNDEEYKALFCIQTAYAIIVKSLAFKVISKVRYQQDLINFNNLIDYDSNTLRHQLEYFENGAIFRDYGITNLLEGDFFSWYVNPEQWNKNVAADLVELYKVLARFSDTPTFTYANRCQDFFKELYQSMVPAAVRHSLGEYYTKKWLARSVIMEALPSLPNKWKAIDPCCGSGTFITVLIELVLSQLVSKSKKEQLDAVLDRVRGIDLNPIATLTARVNYFINISHLLDESQEIEIPIYLGDASYVPKRVMVESVECLQYTITTLQEPIQICVPLSMVKDANRFSKVMSKIEDYIKMYDEDSICCDLTDLCDEGDRNEKTEEGIRSLACQLVELERREWNGVWARIITNFLSTANLGKFELVVGNPPWVDWKSLPSGYRERIKSLCVARHLFSGDTFTGGINLNICALITNVAAQNWLSERGLMAFLMPEPLVFQQSYEGFRNLYVDGEKRLYFQKFVNWNKAGSPFKPVTQKFMTYYIGHGYKDYNIGIPTKFYTKNRNKNIDDKEEVDIETTFTISSGLLGTCHTDKNFFTYADSRYTLEKYTMIAGSSEYVGREGIELYPQELLVFELADGMPAIKDCTPLRNMQNDKSKYKVAQRNVLLETALLHPMIKGKDITPFHAEISDYIVPFPYDSKNPQIPIGLEDLMRRAPRLARYYQENKKLFESQTGYSDKIIGKADAEFYALARVGAYSYANYYVAMRDNTNWAAAVVTDVNTKWGGSKRPVFQNHAISICEDSDGHFISEDEAHYICGILNTPIVVQYMMTSSDSRSFPIRPRIRIPKYENTNLLHLSIVKLSKQAHKNYANRALLNSILSELNYLYMAVLGYEEQNSIVDELDIAADKAAEE